MEKSLVRQSDEAGGEARFGMLQTIRAFALEQLTASGEEISMRNAHAHYFATDVADAGGELFGPEQAAWFDRFETERDDLRAALRWLLDRRDGAAALRLAGGLWPFWLIRGNPSEGSKFLAEATSLDPEVTRRCARGR